MVRTYWLVPVFNEASGNLDLQPDRTDDQVESNFGPVLCEAMVAVGRLSARLTARRHVAAQRRLLRDVRVGGDRGGDIRHR
ncbi:MAG: hypothetical protein QOD14_576 [Solirubrobacterales bacterium]|jgi:hypothetical protein|nr:hypothetical protein [Solirubrobacterales bacterium]